MRLPRDLCPHRPTAKQTAFLCNATTPVLEVLFGGSAGGGKTDAALMAALQYVDVPGYSALILRRSFADLMQPDALIPRSHQWLRGKARWNSDRNRWTFPSGAMLSFGYLEHDGDLDQYQGAAYQTCIFDELTQFPEQQYRYLFSRMRRLAGANVPLRMRATSNPGGRGHDWVKRRFITEGAAHGRLFIRAGLRDNPHLDAASYVRAMANLDPLQRAQLLSGDWDAVRSGMKFERDWFRVVPRHLVPPLDERVRFWDLAATEPTKAGDDPDWTAGVLMGVDVHHETYILDVQHLRGTPLAVEQRIRQTAQRDGPDVAIRIEQEPGASGKSLVDHYVRTVLWGYEVRGVRASGAQELRVNPLSAQAQAGHVVLVEGDWVGDFLDEAVRYPGADSHDDQVVAAAGAFGVLSRDNLAPLDEALVQELLEFR